MAQRVRKYREAASLSFQSLGKSNVRIRRSTIQFHPAFRPAPHPARRGHRVRATPAERNKQTDLGFQCRLTVPGVGTDASSARGGAGGGGEGRGGKGCGSAGGGRGGRRSIAPEASDAAGGGEEAARTTTLRGLVKMERPVMEASGLM
eukprot:5116184-Prymnesium_polylepis.2